MKTCPKLTVSALTLAASLWIGQSTRADTGVGLYPQMDGGFETQAIGPSTVLSSIAAGTQRTDWTVNNTSGAGSSIPGISPNGGRSGPYCMTNFSATAARRFQSPTAANGAIAGSTAYVVQYYYRTSSSVSATNLQGGASWSGTGNPIYSTAAPASGTSGAWSKFIGLITTSASSGSPIYGIGVVRFSTACTLPIDVDDFCVYPGSAADTTAPDSATSPTLVGASQGGLTLGWTDPGTGVDSGGYMVVRSTSDPTAVPNVNGIYAVGDTVNDGVGTPGTVAYLGATPSFADSGLAANTTYYYRIYTVDKAFNYSSAATFSGQTLGTSTPPSGASVTPSSVATNAGANVTFTLTLAAGDPPLVYAWHKQQDGGDVQVATTTNLTFTGVLGPNAGSYYVVVSNTTTHATTTSGVVSLAITGDPTIIVPPHNTFALLDGQAQFTVAAVGTAPTYQWYTFDGASTYTALNDGSQATGSTVSGSKTSALTISDIQLGDPTNFVVVATTAFGSATSAPVALLGVGSNTVLIAYWDFNGPEFTNRQINPTCLTNPVPYLGSGAASPVGTAYTPGLSPFSGVVDPQNGAGTYSPYLGPDGKRNYTNFSWGTSQYPVGNNKQNGVQFNVSTVGAKDIGISYDVRGTGTASKYQRLQYTTNGTDWLDYPTSTAVTLLSTYAPFAYNLTGFPGVADNPDFGFRIVTEFQSTATYGINPSDTYVGIANTYGSAGTLTYDIVSITGDSITNNNEPPVLSVLSDVTNNDFTPFTINFTASDDSTSPDQLAYSAVSLDPSVNADFLFGGSGAQRTLRVTPHYISNNKSAAPILVTATDANGDSTKAWFILTLLSQNQPPVVSLPASTVTNTLANAPITISFTVSDDHTGLGGLTYSVSSQNNTVVPQANIVVNGQGTANPTLVITPAHNQVGLANLSVTVNDNDPTEPRSTTVSLALMVRPNTNVIAIDYFNYDNVGALDTISDGYWTHLTGNLGQLQAGQGAAEVNTLDNTENLQVKLLGAPYLTNSPAILYASFSVNLSDLSRQPFVNGTYFSTFNDGSGVTGPYECRVIVATNGVSTLGDYRLGVTKLGADATSGQMFPMDLDPTVNYVVVTSLVLSNGYSTLWVNPLDQNSPSVVDTAVGNTNYNISDFELRESGGTGGAVFVSRLKIGTTFDSVFPSLHVQPGNDASHVIVTWADPTLSIQYATDIAGPWTDLPAAVSPYTYDISGNTQTYFRFGQ